MRRDILLSVMRCMPDDNRITDTLPMSGLTPDRSFKSATAIARSTWRSFCARSKLRLVITFSCLASLGGGLGAAAERAPHPEALRTSESPTATLNLLRDSGGVLTPALRASYVEWAKNKVLDQVKPDRYIVPE